VDAHALYERGRAQHARSLVALEARARLVATARLAAAAAGIVLLGSIVWGSLGRWAWEALGAVALAFVVLVFIHARVYDAIQRASAALRFHERGLARLALAWDRLPAQSGRFRSADHPFTDDLDVFGRVSLMQIVDATETLFGEERLGRLLAARDPGVWPDEVIARQQAVRDLAGRVAFREALAIAGAVLVDDKPDPSALLRWAEATDRPPSAL
jgi:hypothetical protein